MHGCLRLVFVCAFAFQTHCRAWNFLTKAEILKWTHTCVTIGAAVSVLQCQPCHADSSNNINIQSWNFPNGPVTFPEQLSFPTKNGKFLRTVSKPRFLGSGSGGAVFAFSDVNASSKTRNVDVAVKVSWLRSTSTVENECEVLQILEKRKVSGVETCLAKQRYPTDARRVMIVLEPVVSAESVAAVSELEAPLRPHAVRCIIRTMVQMLAAEVVTSDVQPLMNIQTGDVLFIDLTEAKVIGFQGTHLKKPDDEGLIVSFCNEMLALIPEELYPVAADALKDELKAMEGAGTGGVSFLSSDLYSILRTQASVYFSD